MNHIKPIVCGNTTYFNSTKTSYKVENESEVKYYSYNTLIAFKPAGSNMVYATTKKYSVTTSKQWSVYIVRDIIEQGYSNSWVTQDHLERIVKQGTI